MTAGKQTKGGTQGTRSVLKPTVHQDTWFLRIAQPPADAPANSPPTARWERRKRPANLPSPSRAGATMAYHKGRGILFGGVHDVEESEEGIDSEFFDTLFAWNIERNRFFQLNLRRSKITPKRQLEDRVGTRRGRAEADEAELLRNLAALETKDSITGPQSTDVEIEASGSEQVTKPTKTILMSMPHPRFNAQLAIQDGVLHLFGGTYEHGDVEYTFDEMWAIDLGRLDGVQEVYRRELDNWHGSDDDESASQSEEDISDDEDEGDEPMGVLLPPTDAIEASPSEVTLEGDQPEIPPVDDRPQPRPFESLREFFTRTTTLWQEIVLEPRKQERESAMSIKELRKKAFGLSETRWWDVREEVMALEDEQNDAGIGEVINIMDRSSETGGTNRRR